MTAAAVRRRMPNMEKLSPECPICGGAHHAAQCDNRKILSMISATSECAQCGEPVELIGPFCIECSLDRALRRWLREWKDKI